MDILTGRLHIRDLRREDWPGIHALHMAPEVARFQSWFGARTQEESKAWMEDLIFHNEAEPRSAHNCGIVLQAAQETIGWIGFGWTSAPKNAHGAIDFGYAVLPERWNRGYMTEALRGTPGYIFTQVRADSVFGECAVANPASARVMEKAGMRRVAEFSDATESSAESRYKYRYAIERWGWEPAED
jgi:ribosomal-protein-alanine N-acetyltransferase